MDLLCWYRLWSYRRNYMEVVKKMAAKYDASSIKSLKDDRERLRLRPSVYIIDTYAAGALHIIFEIVDNSIDELGIKDPVGNNLTVTFDTKTKEVTVVDDGRGIPHESLYNVCTVLNTSGKFETGEDAVYQNPGGLNGIGFKTAVYLSKRCEVTSIRDGKSLTYKFEDGILKDTIRSKAKGHGTITKFTIDNKLVEINAVEPGDIKNRLKEKSYCFPDINMIYTIMENGKEVKSHKFCGEDLFDLLKSKKPDTGIVKVHSTEKQTILRNISDDDVTTMKIEVQAAISMKDDALDADTDA
ncbi:MAG: ATP-binding protein, partial [Muribaculaceae bacterium]|nr:ATP-binding protein [Muribaculaceae bacterium]